MTRWLSFIGTFLIFYMFASPAFAQSLEVRAEIDRNPVIVNESFTLTVTANDDLPRWAFSSEPLLRDFVVGATSIDTSSVTTQGRVERTTRWTVRLTARQPGRFIIPAFTIEGAQTLPIDLEVIRATQQADGEQRPFFIQARVSNETPFVQQQVLYEIELFLRNDFPLESGQIAAPEAENADIEQIAQNRERQEIVNGQRYRVISQEYAIIPRRSGPLEIRGARFDGRYRATSSRSLTGFTRPEQTTLFAEDVIIDVQPRPRDFPGAWLPSSRVELHEEWNPDTVMLPLGEPITRTISITAEGVRPEQLPDINLEWPESIRIYPDRGQPESIPARSTRISQMRYSIALIPTELGTFELPEVRVPWFNTRTNRVEYATLPARELTVTSPPGGIPSPRAITPPDAVTAEPTSVADRPDRDSMIEASRGPSTLWFVVVFVLWLLTLFALIAVVQRYRKKPLAQEPGTHIPEHARTALNRLKKACYDNQPHEAREALLAWQSARHGKPVTSLQAIIDEFANESELASTLIALQQTLYSAEKPVWQQGRQLWTAVKSLHQRQNVRSSNSFSLYPS